MLAVGDSILYEARAYDANGAEILGRAVAWHTPSPGVVRLDERGMATLVVQDRGEGVGAEHLPHLTRRFYRTDPGRSRAAGGTGLGLAIVKHIVERHRGRLDIASKRSVGTTVSVRIPLIEDDTAAKSATR